MAKRLPVPPELEHLIEKRDSDDDRRQRKQRDKDRRSEDDLGPIGAIESTPDLREVPTDDRRDAEQRRRNKDRRGKKRRKADS